MKLKYIEDAKYDDINKISPKEIKRKFNEMVDRNLMDKVGIVKIDLDRKEFYDDEVYEVGVYKHGGKTYVALAVEYDSELYMELVEFKGTNKLREYIDEGITPNPDKVVGIIERG